MQNKKILILTLFPAPYRVELYEELGKNFDVTVYYERDFDYGRDAKWFLRTYHNVRGGMLSDKSKSINFNIISKIKKERFDLVLAYEFSSPTAMLLMNYCIIHKVPYFINCDGGSLTRPSHIKDIIKRYFISHASGCLANGLNAENYFLKYGAIPGNIYQHYFTSLHTYDILSEPISQDVKQAKKDRLGIKADKVVIAVGRFIKLKRFDTIIRFWENMPCNIELIIIGGGEERAVYEKIISDLALKNVRLIDYRPKEELKEYYEAADLLIHPTESDVWGLIVNEAMAIGLPVISTDRCIAASELINDGENGYVLHELDCREFVSKANMILQNDEACNRMAQNNISKVSPYTYENNAIVQTKIINEFFEKTGSK